MNAFAKHYEKNFELYEQLMENKNVQSKSLCYRIRGGAIHE